MLFVSHTHVLQRQTLWRQSHTWFSERNLKNVIFVTLHYLNNMIWHDALMTVNLTVIPHVNCRLSDSVMALWNDLLTSTILCGHSASAAIQQNAKTQYRWMYSTMFPQMCLKQTFQKVRRKLKRWQKAFQNKNNNQIWELITALMSQTSEVRIRKKFSFPFFSFKDNIL